VTSHRLERVNGQIQREISDILLRRVNDPRIGFVSVTGVKVSREYDHATVFVSLFGPEAERKATWRGLEQARAFIRSELARRIRLRKTPELVFRLDDTIEHGARIEQQLRTLNVDGASNDSGKEPPGGEGEDGDG